MDKKNGVGVAPQSTYVSPQSNFLQGSPTKTPKEAFKMGLSKQKTKKEAEDVLAEEE